MIVMQMRKDDIGHFIRIDFEQPQRFHRTAQMFALAPDGRFLRKSSVDHEHAVAAAHHPDEVIEVWPVLVRIGQNEALSRVPIS